jgi:light-regulated signal transduction histidine kinase (bacteriophytochrome)
MCRDVSKIRENSKLAADNKMLQVYNSSVSHELLTPLRCIVEISQKLIKQQKSTEAEFNMQLVVNAS